MRPISSLHIVHSFDNRQGGVVHAALSIAKYLNAAGHPAEVVASYAEGDDVKYLSEAFGNVVCHRIPRSFPARNYNAAGLGDWLEDQHERFDIIQLHSVWTGTTARGGSFCRRTNKPYLVYAQNSLDPFDLRKRRLLKKLLGPHYVRSLLGKARGVVCTTQLEKDRLVTYGAAPVRYVVPLPVPAVASSPIDVGKFREQHRIPRDAQVVLFISRFDFKKGLQFLIPALAALKRDFPKLWFLLVGSGDAKYTAEVDRLLDENGIRSWTVLPGFVSGEMKQAVFASSDVFALPSLNENFGIVVVEALRAGVPVVISNQVFLYPEVEESGAGVICEPSTASTEQALRRVLNGSLDIKEMVRRGKTLAADYFSPESATERLVAVYRDALKPEFGI